MLKYDNMISFATNGYVSWNLAQMLQLWENSLNMDFTIFTSLARLFSMPTIGRWENICR